MNPFSSRMIGCYFEDGGQDSGLISSTLQGFVRELAVRMASHSALSIRASLALSKARPPPRWLRPRCLLVLTMFFEVPRQPPYVFNIDLSDK